MADWDDVPVAESENNANKENVTPRRPPRANGRPPSMKLNVKMSPVTRNRKGKLVSKNQKVLIVNKFKALVEDKCEEGGTRVGKCAAADAISQEVGVGSKTVLRTINEYLSTKGVASPNRSRNHAHTIAKDLDDFTMTAIRLKVHAFFHRNEAPTLDKILKSVNEDENLPSFKRTTLYNLLRSLGFVYVKRGRREMMLEKDDIVCWRRRYLKEIRRARSLGKTVYYLDETWVTAGHCTNKAWIDVTVKSAKDAFFKGLSAGLKEPPKGKRVIILHMGSERGFVPNGLFTMDSNKTGDYHEEMNSEVFEAWLKDILPELDPGAVIVMDNASYHSRQAEKIPNTSWNKPQIVEWLQRKGIPADLSYLKAELLEMVRNLNCKPVYVVDEIVKASGRSVLRLPPYHCVLNPIEMIWANLKGFVARNNTTFKLSDVKELLLQAEARITAVEWSAVVKHVIEKVETDMWNIDLITEQEDNMEPIVINFGDDVDSSDDGW